MSTLAIQGLIHSAMVCYLTSNGDRICKPIRSLPGYNAQTPDANYMNTTTAIQRLVDIVSKNGNWLREF